MGFVLAWGFAVPSQLPSNQARLRPHLLLQEGGGLRMDASPANCRACCEGALARLGVDAIDLFTMRGPPDPKVPIEETMAEVKASAFRLLASELSPWCLRSKACDLPHTLR